MGNDKRTVSLRLDAEKVTELDDLARAQTRDRTYLINEAVEAYLDVQRWQLEHIREGIRQADSGKGSRHKDVVTKWRRRMR